MTNKPKFQNSQFLVFTMSCFALMTASCTKSDSLGGVGANDGGADADGSSCAMYTSYKTAGCGSSAVPLCGELPQDACPAVEDYCSCDGKTTIQGRCGLSFAPFLHAGACQTSPDGSPAPDTFQGPEASAGPEASGNPSCNYPTESTRSDAGEVLWSWYFTWVSASPTLAAMCAAWGANARMILEVMVPASTTGTGTTLPICTSEAITTGSGSACSVADTRRFEAACTDGHFLLQLPSENTFNAFYHLESANYPNSPRHVPGQAVEGCVRNVSAIPGGPTQAINDGGVDVAPDGAVDLAPDSLTDSAPEGAGIDAIPPGLDGGVSEVRPATDLGGENVANPCAACTANQVCVQSFDGTCRTGGVGCKTVSDACRTKLLASGAKSCSSLSECQSEFCSSPYQCVINSPCGTEAPQAALYCYGP